MANPNALSARQRSLRLFAYAAITLLSFPHAWGQGSVDFGFALAWFAPVCLVLCVEGLRPGRAALWGFAAGTVAHAAVLHWIYVVTVTYGHAAPVVGVVAPLGLGAYVGLFTAAFGAALARFAQAGGLTALTVAVLWTCLDHLRSFFLTGFPWATLGYAQHENPVLMALAPVTGVYGLSFATVLVGIAGLRAVRAWRMGQSVSRSDALAVLATSIVCAGLYWGNAVEEDPAARRVSVAVVQGNIDQGVKWSPKWAERTLDTYESLSRRAASEGAEIILWPETAVPGSIDREAIVRDRLEELARSTGTTLVVGGVGIEGQRPPVKFFDSAYVFDPTGELVTRYDKSHLVPFGEYVPLRDLIGLFVSAVARGIAPDNVTAGEGPRALSMPPGALVVGAPLVSAGVPICYELLFPDLVRRFVGDGAGVLFAITNDAWYGRTGAPFQFLAITALRSAESRVWTARAANTGVSGFIDPRGRVVVATQIFEPAVQVARIPVEGPKRSTFYVRHGDRFAQLCWFALLIVGVASVRRREA